MPRRMLEWLYKAPGQVALDSCPDDQETHEDLIARRPDLALKHGLIPMQRAVVLELMADPENKQG